MKPLHRESQLAHLDAGTGPAVVLLHGYPFDSSMWSEQVDFLSGHGYRVIAPDLPGFGKRVAQTLVCELVWVITD